jgi:phosphohistidine phosphatase
MPELILLRHAKAVDKSVDDFSRELTEEGRQQAQRIGRALLRQGLQPDRVVSSPAARALETARLVCTELGIPHASIVQDRTVFDAEVVHLVASLEHHGAESKRVMLVGHNPGLTDLGAYLLKPAPDGWQMRKGAAAHLTLDRAWAQVAQARGILGAVLEP